MIRENDIVTISHDRGATLWRVLGIRESFNKEGIERPATLILKSRNVVRYNVPMSKLCRHISTQKEVKI